MRKPTDICLLCKEKIASKRNSHIIPKFMGQGIFEGTKPRHGLMLTNTDKQRKIQDIAKEDYLFCEDCEKGFSILETYCSLRLEQYNNVKYSNLFIHNEFSGIEYVEFKNFDIKIYNLFIYSIIWRVSVSNNYGFQKFKLQIAEEEKLRIILKQYSSNTQNDLLNSINNLILLPEHCHVIFRPIKKLRPPASMLSAGSYNDWMHQIHLVDYVLIYLTDSSRLVNELRIIDNNRIENLVRIGLADKDSWKSFNFEMINNILKRKKK